MSRPFRFGPPRHKFNAVRTELDGLKFDSKAEARRYAALKLLKAAGEVVFFLRQPMFDLPGGVRYRADFQVFWADGRVTFEDVKGVLLPAFIKSRKMVESLYPVTIDTLK